MSSLNQVNLIGRVGQDPEVKYLPNGDPVANVSLATTEKWKDKQSGQPKEHTEWHRLNFYGKLAEIVGEYVTKGGLIFVTGKLKTREWEKDGVKRYTTEIQVSEMKMLGNKGDNAGQGRDGNNKPQQQPQQRPAQQPQQQQPGFDDDIPF
jgi:single-strand DNA-binding protein